MFDPEEFRVILASPEHADVCDVLRLLPNNILRRSPRFTPIRPPCFIIHSVTTGKAIFLIFTFYSSTFPLCAALGDIYADFCSAFCSSPSIIKWKHSISLPSTFFIIDMCWKHWSESCAFICVFFCESENFYHTRRNLHENIAGFFLQAVIFLLRFFGSCTAWNGWHMEWAERAKKKEKTPRIVSLIINDS